MWILVKDHLRRNWKSLTLMTLGFACGASFMMWDASDTLHLPKAFPLILYVCYALLYVCYAFLASRIWMNNNLDFIRFSRTLPLRDSTLATLIWSMSVVAPPAFSFVIVLLLGCLAFCFGKAHALPIAWPLLFLLLATLCSGVLTFARALIPCLSDPVMARHQMQKGCALSALYFARVMFAGPCAVVVIVLLFYRTPARWSDLTPLHLAGMGLAAFLTWRSYRLRYWLLQFDFPWNAISQRPPNLEDALKSKGITPLDYDRVTAALVYLSKSSESAPPHYGSVLTAVAQDLKTIVRGSLISVLLGIGSLHLMLFCLAWSGWAPDVYESFTSGITLIAFFLAAMEVDPQFRRLSALGAVRALPLTGNQCVLLFLSYPYAVTLAVVPCLSAYLWLTGYGHPSILLLGGILLGAVLCPFAMFLVARFGVRSFFILMFGFFFVGNLVFVLIVLTFPRFAVYLTSLSPPILYAGGVLLLAVLGIVGFFGLRHVIDNNSAVYKRKISPQPFFQWLGR